jgi:hypothetical protein
MKLLQEGRYLQYTRSSGPQSHKTIFVRPYSTSLSKSRLFTEGFVRIKGCCYADHVEYTLHIAIPCIYIMFDVVPEREKRARRRGTPLHILYLATRTTPS